MLNAINLMFYKKDARNFDKEIFIRLQPFELIVVTLYIKAIHLSKLTTFTDL